jgi:serine/threonine-protein kinase RsbW
MGVAGSNRHGHSRPPPPPPERGGNGQRGGRPNRLVFTIPSDFAAGRQVQKEILQDVERHGFAGQSFFAINLALEEALTNAIKHGNRLDPNKKVRIEAKVSAKQAQITVEDEGEGFDRGGVPDPTARENLEKCSGRGILLIEAYMSRVTWDRGGRRVKMVKVKDGPASDKV